MIRTNYSFRNSVGTREEIKGRLIEIGLNFYPVADFCSTMSNGQLSEFDNPIYGVTIPVSPQVHAKKPVTDDFVFLAKESVSDINRLLTHAYTQFRYTPLLKYFDLPQNVIKITGYKARLDELDPTDPDLYVGLSVACAKGYIRKAEELGFKFCAAQVNRYPREEDKQFWEVLTGESNPQTYPQHILSDEEWKEHLKWCDDELLTQAIANRDAIFEQCKGVTFPSAHLPHVDGDLRAICEERLAELQLGEEYKERLERELKVISDKGLEDYFLIYADFMSYARTKTVVGPGRGSSAGSLVCYLTQITNVDPVANNLLFERFLDPTRLDAADIDCDFGNRDLIVDYLAEKYGNVAKIGTSTNYQKDNTVNEVCKALQVPKYMLTDMLAQAPDYAANDPRKEGALREALEMAEGQMLLHKFPELEVMKRFGGLPRNAGTHASGVLLTAEPLTDFFAVDTRTNTAQCEAAFAEKLGCLKLDILGLHNLSILEYANDLLGQPINFFDGLDGSDIAPLQVLNDHKFQGIFQIEGAAARRYAEKITFESVEDLCAILAIARPGPMSSGAADKWVARRMGDEAVTFAHEAFEPYLKSTYGLLVYQEQLMQISRNVAKMEWKDVQALRKAVQKSKGEAELEKFKDLFCDGCIANGVPEEVVYPFWSDLVGFGRYCFNKSHAYAYAMISYWCCYMKFYHPLEFAAGLLSFKKDPVSQLKLLREIGIPYKAVDIEKSIDKWSVRNGELLGPLSLINGIGPKVVNQILSARARGEELSTAIQKKLANATTPLDNLYPIREMIAKTNAQNVIGDRSLTPFNDVVADGSWDKKNLLLCGLAIKCEVGDENEPKRQADRQARGDAPFKLGPTKFYEIRLADDDAEVYCKVLVKDFERFREEAEKIEVDKSIVLVRGDMTPTIDGFVMVRNIKVLEMEE